MPNLIQGCKDLIWKLSKNFNVLRSHKKVMTLTFDLDLNLQNILYQS